LKEIPPTQFEGKLCPIGNALRDNKEKPLIFFFSITSNNVMGKKKIAFLVHLVVLWFKEHQENMF
jgi:hypothetical protein